MSSTYDLDRVPLERVRALNDAPVRPDGDYVLYWMVATRRPVDSFALERAVEWAHALNRPLLVLEALRVDHPWASARVHSFVLQGMAANQRAFAARGVRYHPYVEPAPGAASGLIESLGARACVVVSDDWPAFFLPRMQQAAADRLEVRLELVDDVGLLPMGVRTKLSPSAVVFRRWYQRDLPDRLDQPPAADPTQGAGLPGLTTLPAALEERWPAAPALWLEGTISAVASLPVDAAVPPVQLEGGWVAALARWRAFSSAGLGDYAKDRNRPDASSGLSPYLHFGHISPWRMLLDILDAADWDPMQVGMARGQRAGWWGLSEGAEAYLDQLVTWRELGFHHARWNPGFFSYDGLPDWARATLEAHTEDPRPWGFTLAELEAAATHDPVWNAAQRQLRTQGVIDGYLRMVWGKRILEWSEHPRQAWDRMHAINDRWALDGRGPNGTSGIAWVMGRFDRPWGPRRPVFGTIRYMSSERTVKKLALGAYLERWGDDALER